MGYNRLDSCQKDKKIQFEGNNTSQSSPRMKCSYIHLSLSKYKLFYPFSPFLFRLHVSFFMEAIPLYSLLLLDSSPPLIDYVNDFLDACPIRTLLWTLYVAVGLNITV